MTRFLKIPNKFKISQKIWKKLNKFQENFSTLSKQSPKIQQIQKNSPNPNKAPKNFTKRQKPPPSPYFQPFKPFFVIFRNTFLKKFANFCHKSEKLYYNFIVIKNLFAKPCLSKRITASAHALCGKQKPAQTPFATQIFSSKFTAKRISSTKKERTRDEEITHSHHTRAF